MVVALAALCAALAVLAVSLGVDLHEERARTRAEAARVTDLLNRLAARNVAEYQAWQSPTIEHDDLPELMFDPTGLIGVVDYGD